MLNTKNIEQDAHAFSPTILREYDIRGQVNKNLNSTDAYFIGKAFGSKIIRDGGRTVCVGYDGRHSSPEFAQSLTDGLISTGINVTMIGLGPSPMLYFAVKSLDADAGVMVTGSHNPADYNGFKMMRRSGSVYGDQIQELGQIAASGDFESGQGTTENKDIKTAYVARLLQDLDHDRPLKIAWDAGNGAAGEILRMLTEKLPGQHILLYDDIDGGFPNHHPDPTVDKNLKDLIQCVRDNNCDLGIAFDGDGDRIGVVNEKGDILRCDILMTIYAQQVLETRPGASIIGDVKCSQVMVDDITSRGGNAVIWKTGHSLIKAKMQELNAPLAGELSGHIFFADRYYGFDDALYCSIRLINAMSADVKALSHLTQNLPQLHSTPEIRIDVDEEKKFDLIPKIFDSIEAQNLSEFEISDIDGIRLSCDDGWWLLRASNTQNVLVCRVEADTEESLERLKNMARAEVEKIGYTLNFDE